MIQLRDRLRELRGRRTQRELIDEFNAKYDIKLRQNNYSNWENGKEPNIQTLILLADFHGVSLDYLLGRVDYTDTSFEETCSDTGLTERAIKGLHAIQQSSRLGKVNIFKALIYLLESELDEDCQHDLNLVQNNADSFFWYELDTNLTPSLSAILFYIANSFPETVEATWTEKCRSTFKRPDCYKMMRSFEYADHYAEKFIPYHILSSLRYEYQKRYDYDSELYKRREMITQKSEETKNKNSLDSASDSE